MNLGTGEVAEIEQQVFFRNEERLTQIDNGS